MALDARTKQVWERVQSNFSYPVDPVGNPIIPDDEETLRSWHEEGISRYVQRGLNPGAAR